jgi:hypothetical protein
MIVAPVRPWLIIHVLLASCNVRTACDMSFDRIFFWCVCVCHACNGISVRATAIYIYMFMISYIFCNASGPCMIIYSYYTTHRDNGLDGKYLRFDFNQTWMENI